jgi:RNA polymerase sigma-70 factor (ECF subfamily)
MDELTLVEASKRGDTAAFGLLVDQYYRTIYRSVYHHTGNHHDADDLCQQTFLQAVSNIGSLRDANSFRRWIFTISANLAKKRWKKNKRNRAVPLASDSQLGTSIVADVCNEPAAALSAKEKASIVQEKLQQMPEHMRMVAVLILMEGFAQKEAAAILKCSEATISRHLSMAKKWLRNTLQDLI